MQMLDAVRNAFRLPDLRRKLLYTLFIILVYQFAAHIPVPGVNRAALNNLLNGQGGGIIQTLNLLSGGAVSQMSVLANGVYPYITAQIIIQLLMGVIPQLEAIAKEPGGQDKLNQYTYYLAIPMGLLQAIGVINLLQSQITGGSPLLPGFGVSGPNVNILLTVSVLATMTAGTMFAIWLGELITEQGIGNGLSLIIFSGIVAQVPRGLGILIQDQQFVVGNLLAFLIITVGAVVVIVFVEQGTRRIPVQYGKRVRGRSQTSGGSTFIPMKVNSAGMIPLIFAQAIVAFPAILAGIFIPNTPFGISITQTFGTREGLWYWVFEFVLVFAFTYFYADVMLQNQDLAGNLQKQGGFIPGIRPGKRTETYITKVTRRITFAGATYLALIAVLPGLFFPIYYLYTGRTDITATTNPAQVMSSAGLIIVVGVVMDTLNQLESQLVMRNYEGFLR